MGIIQELSSQVGERGGKANGKVAQKCLENVSILAEVAEGLTNIDHKIVADCCEVFTEVAKHKPVLIVPYADRLPAMLSHKNGRVRWEAMHCLALSAALIPDVISPQIKMFEDIIKTDTSIIVRDYAIDGLGNFAKSGQNAARMVYSVLKESLTLWEGRHAALALEGLLKVLSSLPELKGEIIPLVNQYIDHPKGSVRKAAQKLIKLYGKL